MDIGNAKKTNYNNPTKEQTHQHDTTVLGLQRSEKFPPYSSLSTHNDLPGRQYNFVQIQTKLQFPNETSFVLRLNLHI